MSKIKVLVIGSDSSVKGGITTVINQYLNSNLTSVDFSLLPTYIEGKTFEKCLFYLNNIGKLVKKLMTDAIDIVHIHMSYKGSFFRKYIVAKVCKIFKKKVVLHLHGSEFKLFYDKSNKIIQKLIINLFEKCDCTIVLGDYWKECILEIAPNARVEIFNNSINIPNSKVSRPDETINVLFLGVLIKRKGIYDLLEVIRQLSQEGILKEKNIKFIFGGDGKEYDAIKQKVYDYELVDYVELMGWVDSKLKNELLQKAHLFVLPSYNEGLPMAILEAMSYGIPVVSTNVGSIKEVVIYSYTGYLVNPGNQEELKNSILNCLADSLHWEEMSRNCIEIIEKNFNEIRYFEKVEDLYYNLIK